MTDVNRPALDDKGLRQFAAIFAGVIFIVFGVVFPYLLEKPTPSWPWALGSGVLVWGLGFPATFRHFYRLWMCLLFLNAARSTHAMPARPPPPAGTSSTSTSS